MSVGVSGVVVPVCWLCWLMSCSVGGVGGVIGVSLPKDMMARTTYYGGVLKFRTQADPTTPGEQGRMPQIGFGTGGIFDSRVILNALQVGYRHIDTALLYGNQKQIGEAIRNFSRDDGSEYGGVARVSRKDLFVTTKLGFYPTQMALPLPPVIRDFVNNTSVKGYSRENAKGFEKIGIEQSLSESGLSYFDLCLVHTPVTSSLTFWTSEYPHEFTNWKHDEPIKPISWIQWAVSHLARVLSNHLTFPDNGYRSRKRAWKNLEALQKEGKCRYIGVSNYEVPLLQELMEYAEVLPAVNQLEIHPLRQMKEVRKFCEDNGIAVVGYGTGVVINHPVIKELGNKYNKSPAQIVLRWAIQSGIGVIPKTTRESRMRSNLESFKFKLDVPDMKILSDLDEGRAFYWETSNLHAREKQPQPQNDEL